jgi:hypothetical protein
MDIAEAESQIISILFHPRICRSVKRMVGECGTVMEQTGETLTHRRVKFAYTLPIGDAADATRCRVVHWLKKKRMHIVCSNFGVVNENESEILGSDLLVAYDHSLRQSSSRNRILTICTLMLHSNSTPEEISDSLAHTRRLQHMLSVSYNIYCRSVVILCGENGEICESWI